MWGVRRYHPVLAGNTNNKRATMLDSEDVNIKNTMTNKTSRMKTINMKRTMMADGKTGRLRPHMVA